MAGAQGVTGQPTAGGADLTRRQRGEHRGWEVTSVRVICPPRGLLLVDNTLWSGTIVRANPPEADASALRAFNDLVASDPRVEVVVFTAFDGLTITRKT
jgi:hypothetical protein